MNTLRVLIRIRSKIGRPKGWRNRDVKRLMELARILWCNFSRRYRIKWMGGVILEE